jgi:uncharacterized membrane protein
MGNLSDAGRIFYGIAIAVLGFLTIYYGDFPYMLIPPKHSWIPGLATLAYISGAMLILAGACIVFEKKIWPTSLLLGSVLLLIFCFYFIPYEFIVSSNYMIFSAWENAAKELALSGGAFVIAGCFLEKNNNLLIRFLKKVIPFGAIFFSITIISFGINHFLNPKGVSTYIPSWVPYRIFWAYFTGTTLIGSGIAIILKIKPGLTASLLGTMIFIWFIILHIPRVVASPVAYMGSEVASACLALAYSGIAFVIAGATKKQQFNQMSV